VATQIKSDDSNGSDIAIQQRKVKSPLDPHVLAFARKPRQQCSDAEQLVWRLLRGRRLSGMKFRRQHPLAPFVLDFYCDEAKLAIERDGGQHNTDKSRRYDLNRTAFINKQGISVLRFWNHEVLEDTETVLEAIHNALTPALSRRERES
jgi:very-short-patch-repair endonuclease